MKKSIVSLLALLFVSLFSWAQNSVWLYEGCNYTGRGFQLEVGQFRMFQMKIGNDRLQGMQIPNGMKVTIYENEGFQGKSKTYFNNQPCLEPEFRNTASSIVVEYVNGQPGYNQNDFVTFYNDCAYRGYSRSLGPGVYNGSQLGELKLNISSLRIEGNVIVKAFLNNEFNSGFAVTLDNSNPCLPGQYNDKIGSLTIEYKPNNPGGGNNNGGGIGGGGGWRPRTYATLYSECQNEGNSLRLQPGYYDGSKLGILKFNIQSIELPANLRIRAYLNTESLTGTSFFINSSTSCLSSQYANRIGALIIEENTGSWGNNGSSGGYGNPVVQLYTDNDYRGQSIALVPGTYPLLSSLGFPDKALRSIQIPNGYKVVLYDQPNLRGFSYTLTSSRTGLNLIGWQNRTSSIAIYRD